MKEALKHKLSEDEKNYSTQLVAPGSPWQLQLHVGQGTMVLL